MGQYVFQWAYQSGLGSWTQGTVVDLSDEQARHLNADSPGVIVPFIDDIDRSIHAALVAAAAVDDDLPFTDLAEDDDLEAAIDAANDDDDEDDAGLERIAKPAANRQVKRSRKNRAAA